MSFPFQMGEKNSGSSRSFFFGVYLLIYLWGVDSHQPGSQVFAQLMLYLRFKTGTKTKHGKHTHTPNDPPQKGDELAQGCISRVLHVLLFAMFLGKWFDWRIVYRAYCCASKIDLFGSWKARPKSRKWGFSGLSCHGFANGGMFSNSVGTASVGCIYLDLPSKLFKPTQMIPNVDVPGTCECPLFLALTPPNQGFFESKQGSSKGSR